MVLPDLGSPDQTEDAVGKLIMWNLVTLDGYFEGEHSWDLPWHERVWGDELEQLSIAQVCSRTLAAAAWNNTTRVRDDVTRAIAALKRGRSLHAHGECN